MKEDAMFYPRYATDDFKAGEVREQAFMLSRAEVDAFSTVSGDHHPLHSDGGFAAERGYPDVLVHGMLVASRCSAFVAHDFVGSHGLLVSLASDFRQPVFCGEALTWRAEVSRVNESAGTVEVSWQVRNPRGAVVQRGSACSWLPRQP